MEKESIQTLTEPITGGIYLQDLYVLQHGKMMLYTVASGVPCIFNAYNITDRRLEMTAPLPGTQNCWSIGSDHHGNVYIAPQDTAKLFRYSPITKQVEDLGSIFDEKAAYHVSFDEADRVYMGTAPGGKLVRYDGNGFYDYGAAYPGHQYIRSQVYYNGFVYAGTLAEEAKLIRIDVQTGERTEIPNPPFPGKAEKIQSYYSMTLVEHYIFIYTCTEQNKWLFIYDADQGVYLEQCAKNFRGLFTSGLLHGKVYFDVEDVICSFDLQTGNIEKTKFTFDNENCRGFGVLGDELLLLNHKTMRLHRMNMKTGEQNYEEVCLKEAPLPLQTMEMSPQGKLVMSAYMGCKGSIYDPVTKQNQTFPFGQAEGIMPLEDRIFFGVYPGGRIYELSDGETLPRLIKVLGEEQDRPFQMQYADGKLWIGTIPDYSKYGGAISVYDLKTGSWEVHRNIVKDQSIIGLAYKDGMVYGSTTVWGGLGKQPKEKAAKVFRWNFQTKETELETELCFPEISKPIDKIGNVVFGRDGLLWGTAENIVFGLRPEDLSVQKYVQLDRPLCRKTNWRPRYLRWRKDGRLYVNVNGITAVNIDTMETEQILSRHTELFVLDDHDRIYFEDSTKLCCLSEL